MPRQIQINPSNQGRRQEDDEVYDQPGNAFTTPTGIPKHASEASQNAQNTLDNIDDVLRDNEEANLFNDTGEGSGAVDNEALASGEKNVDKNAGNQDEDDDDDNFYNDKGDKKTKVKGKFSKKKAGIAGALVGLLGTAVIGGGFFAGPFEFIHISQLLSHAHFGINEDQSDERFGKMVKYLVNRNKGTLYRTRLGYLGNKYADKIFSNIEEGGLKPVLNKNGKYLDGWEIDRDNPKFAGKSVEELDQEFNEKYGVHVNGTTDADGVEHATIDLADKSNKGVGALREKNVINVGLAEGDYPSGVRGVIQAHVAGERFGWTWHPLQRGDTAINRYIGDKVDDFKTWAKEQAGYVEKGATNIPIDSSTPKTEEENPPPGSNPQADQANSGAASNEANQTTGAAQADQATIQAGGEPVATATKLAGLKIGAASAAAVTGIMCLLRGLDQQATTIKQAQEIKPLARLGAQAASIGAEIASDQDVNNRQMAQFSNVLYNSGLDLSVPGTDNSGKGSLWSDSQPIRAESGDPNWQDGLAPDTSVQTLGTNSPFHFTNDGSALSEILGGACSTIGQTIQIGFSLLTGGILSTLSGVVGGAVLGPPILSAAAHWLAGNAISILTWGGDWGTYADYGELINANEQAISTGATQLTQPQLAVLQQQQNQEDQQEFASKSIAYKLFNPYDRNTLISHIIDQQAPGVMNNTDHMATTIAHLGSSLTTTLADIFLPKAHAAATYQYSIPTYGFCEQDMENPNLDDPFDNAEQVATILDNDTSGTYIKKAQQMFGVNLVQSTQSETVNGQTQQVPVWDVQEDPNFESASQNIYSGGSYSNPPDCGGSDMNWLRIRMFIFDTETMKGEACYDGNIGSDTDGDQSCSDLGDSTSDAEQQASLGAPTDADVAVAPRPRAGSTANTKPAPGSFISRVTSTADLLKYVSVDSRTLRQTTGNK